MPIFGMLPIEVSSRPDITLSELRVYNAIASFQGSDESSFPGLDSIAERAGINNVNCSKAISKLIRKKLVDRKRRYGTSNVYTILYEFKSLEELREERKKYLKEIRNDKLKNFEPTILSKLDNIETRQDEHIESRQDDLIEIGQDSLIETRYTKRTDKITNEKKRGKEEAEPQNSLSFSSLSPSFYSWLKEEHGLIQTPHMKDPVELNRYMMEQGTSPELLLSGLKDLVPKMKRIQKLKYRGEASFGKQASELVLKIPNNYSIQNLLRFAKSIESCEAALPSIQTSQPEKKIGELSTLEKQKRQVEYSNRPKQEDKFWKSALENAKKEAI